MNREKIANELVSMAKSLVETGEGSRRQAKSLAGAGGVEGHFGEGKVLVSQKIPSRKVPTSDFIDEIEEAEDNVAFRMKQIANAIESKGHATYRSVKTDVNVSPGLYVQGVVEYDSHEREAWRELYKHLKSEGLVR